jgi:uroporphyrinogen-III synthase
MTRAGRLGGVGVLVTRPRAQAEGLLAAIQAEGGTAIALPALEIAPPLDLSALSAQIGRLREFDLIVFVSPTSVEEAWPHILARHGNWPHGFSLAAVGQGSARMLHRFGARQVLVPEAGADSESLLALPELQAVTGKRVLIFRGEGGREVLAETLRQRGAQAEYAECYRRVRPQLDPAPVLALWREGGVQAVTVTSSEILANLLDLLGAEGLARLQTTPLFVIHERIGAAARQLGLTEVIVTEPGDAGLLAALLERFAGHGS